MDFFTAPHLLGESAALVDDVNFAWFASTVPFIETKHSASCGNASLLLTRYIASEIVTEKKERASMLLLTWRRPASCPLCCSWDVYLCFPNSFFDCAYLKSWLFTPCVQLAVTKKMISRSAKKSFEGIKLWHYTIRLESSTEGDNKLIEFLCLQWLQILKCTSRAGMSTRCLLAKIQYHKVDVMQSVIAINIDSIEQMNEIWRFRGSRSIRGFKMDRQVSGEKDMPLYHPDNPWSTSNSLTAVYEWKEDKWSHYLCEGTDWIAVQEITQQNHLLTSHFLLKVSVSSCKSDRAASNTFVGVSFESIVSTRTWQSKIRGCGIRYPAKRTLESRRSWSRIKLPNVWSSFDKTNVPALGFLLSFMNDSLFSSLSSSHLHDSARSGTLMIFADMTDYKKIEASKSPKFAGWRSRLFCNEEVRKSRDTFSGSSLGCVFYHLFYLQWERCCEQSQSSSRLIPYSV